jgi:hypothetical protein
MEPKSNVKKVTISDVDFYITKIPPFEALPMFFDLQREVLPALGNLLSAFDDKGSAAINAAAEDDGLVKAFRELSERLDGRTVQKWVDLLLTEKYIAVTINGRDERLSATVRNLAFSDLGDILELLYHVIRFNFADFLERWAGRSGLAQKLLAKLSDGSGKISNMS